MSSQDFQSGYSVSLCRASIQRGISTRHSDRSRRITSSLWMTTTGNPACSVRVIGDDRDFHRDRQGEPLFSPQSFLLAYPPGPYTCLRTTKNRSVAMLSFHLNRLWESAEATDLKDVARHEGRRSLERRTVDAISRAMEAFLAVNNAMEQACPECMVTILYVHQRLDPGDGHGKNICPQYEQREGTSSPGSSQPLKILAHAWPLSLTIPECGGSEMEVLVAGSRRLRPESKHSSWLRDRRHLDAAKAKAGAAEVSLSEVIVSREGAARRVLLEGLTSNIFAVEEDGTLFTAPSGVLLGGMRQLCIECCAQEGLRVNLEPPDLSRAGRWQAAFLTGTGRILAPISAFRFLEDVDSEMVNSSSGWTLDVVRPKLSMTRERQEFEHDSSGSHEIHDDSNINPPRFEVKGSEEETSVVQRLRSYMVAALESSATRLL